MSTIAIEKSSGNVYADLGLADAQEMLVKAKLASKIGEIIQRQNLTQQQAAQLLAMPQPKVSLLLRGQFRGISEAKMLECLARLGRDIDIVVKPARRRALSGTVGRVNAFRYTQVPRACSSRENLMPAAKSRMRCIQIGRAHV